MKASELGYQKAAAYLLSNGADVNAIDNNGLTALHWALRSDQVDTFRFLVERGADIEIADNYSITPAFAAALFGRADLYLYLREHGARIDQVLDDGTTIIHAAVSGGQRAIVRMYLRRATISTRATPSAVIRRFTARWTGWTPISISSVSCRTPARRSIYSIKSSAIHR